MSEHWTFDFPHLVNEWDSSNTRSIKDVTHGSNFVAGWTCSKGHSWKAPVKSRTVMKSGCPYCSGRRPIAGETDLATLRPDMAAEWSSNNAKPATEVAVTSHKKAEWICADGHTWTQTAAARAKGKGCPTCARYTSAENSVAALYPDLAVEWSSLNAVPADRQKVNTYRAKWDCPSCGATWGASILDRVAGKKCPCCSDRFLVIGINDVRTLHPELCDKCIDGTDLSKVMSRSQKISQWVCPRGHTYLLSIRTHVKKGVKYCPVCRSCGLDRASSLSESHPHIAKMWVKSDEGKTPDTVISGSTQVVTWGGECGHTWERSIRYQTKNSSCPKCRSRYVKQGTGVCAPTTPLTETHPEIIDQWSSDNDIDPSGVHARSSRKVLWDLPCGHTASIVVKYHVNFPDRCPVCSGKQVVAGINDLATLRPDLAQEWDDEDRDATEVTISSGYKAKWKGKCGHTWRTPVCYRGGSGSGCPFCSNNSVMQGFNDIATTHPELAKQWHSSNDKRATEIIAGSNVKVTWECALGHIWNASPLMRAFRGTGCPVCTGRTVSNGFNDLNTTHPDVAAQWHPTKNNGKFPHEVTQGSRQKVWWKGECGHEWKATVLNRKNGSGCPQCANRVSKGESELRSFVEKQLPNDSVIGSDTSVLGGRRELDIYIPSLNMAIEFNGLYWHSDVHGKDQTYHASKTREAANKGIRVIHVWEDDWRDRRNIVENMLRSRLGTDSREKLSARNLNVVSVQNKDAKTFLNKEHIQGYVSGTFYDGLATPEGEVVALLVTTRTRSEYRIDRYATSAQVRGGFGKLLKVLTTRIASAGGGEIVTFANLDLSEGALYHATGFTHRGTLRPDYMYIYGDKRVHKFNFRKARFRDDPKLIYSPTLTETELAKLNKIPRVYDAGKMRFVKTVPSADDKLVP